MTKGKHYLRFVALRLLTFLEIGLKFCLFLPILAFMVWFSYQVDISGLFQGELAPREVANMLLAGENVSNYEQMDERQVLELYVQNLPEDAAGPETLAIGSSRVLQLSQDLVGTGSYYNAGMSGAGAMDIMNAFYLFDRAGKLPKNLIVEVDPWLFNPNFSQDRADQELFAEFLQTCLQVDSGYEEPGQLQNWQALLDPAYFQGNVKHYLKQRQTGQAANEDGSQIPFQPVAGSLEALDYTVKLADGSIWYPQDFRNWNYDQVMAEALVQAGTIQSMHGFDAMDYYWTNLFEQFIAYVQSRGVNVVFLLTPYHPFIIKHVYNNPQGLGGFFEVEPWIRQYAAKHDIPVYGSYHASRVGIQEPLFYDGIHCKPEALRLIFPGIQAALEGQQTAYETLYQEEYGAQYPELVGDALVGSTADCLVVDETWGAQAAQLTGTGAPYAGSGAKAAG